MRVGEGEAATGDREGVAVGEAAVGLGEACGDAEAVAVGLGEGCGGACEGKAALKLGNAGADATGRREDVGVGVAF